MSEHYVAGNMKPKRTGRMILYLALFLCSLFAAWGIGVSVASGETETVTANNFYMQLDGHEVYVLQMEYIEYRPFQVGEELTSP